jgi:arylsulfatase A-like enzyme
MLFRNAVADPVCSPTRGTLMTGRYAYRYGIGSAIPPKKGWGLPASEVLLPKVLREGADYHSAVVGKWHLATPDMGGLDHVRAVGFDHHRGTMGNLLGPVMGTTESQSYSHWNYVVDGEMTVSREYITTRTIDDALALMRELPEPWFIHVAFHVGHFPMHLPPRDLFSSRVSAAPSEGELYRAMVESMDTELGRLFDGMDPVVLGRTDVIFMGDNGTAPVGVQDPFPKTQSKGSLLQGGVAIPFIVAGPDVVGRGVTTDALVNTSDVFATFLEIAHLDAPAPADSVSFAPVLRDPSARTREFAYAERFTPNGMGPWDEHIVAIRDHRYKLIVTNGQPESMFDLVADPFERVDLFQGGEPNAEQMAAFRRLKHALPDVVPVPRDQDEALRADGIEPPERL